MAPPEAAALEVLLLLRLAAAAALPLGGAVPPKAIPLHNPSQVLGDRPVKEMAQKSGQFLFLKKQQR